MSLRVNDDNRPGYALLDFGRDISAGDVQISLRSKLFNAGEYLGAGGKWSKAPYLFTAVRLPDAGAGVYRIGPEIVNQQDLAHDTIEVSVSGKDVAEEVAWPELTPAAQFTEQETAIYREPAVSTAPKPAAQEPKPYSEPSRKPEEKPLPPKDKEKQPTPAWLKFGAPAGAALFALVALYWMSSRSPSAFDLAVACAKSKAVSESCDAAQCFEGFLALNGRGEERERAERLKEPYDYQCKSAFKNAQICAERNRADPCAARECYETFLKDPKSPRENLAEADRLLNVLLRQCKDFQRSADDAAAAKAHTCISERSVPPCRRFEDCVGAYVTSFPNGAHRDELSQFARQTFDACKKQAERTAENQKAEERKAEEQRIAEERKAAERKIEEQKRDDDMYRIAKDCADHAECQRKRGCFDLYRNAFPNGLHSSEAELAMSAPCENRSSAETAPLPNGMYKGRAGKDESCGAKAGPVIVTIRDGRICWEHGLGFENKWEGSVGADGTVEAKVRGRSGTRASGSAINGGAMSIDMTYPECQNPIRIQLGGMIPGAPAPCP